MVPGRVQVKEAYAPSPILVDFNPFNADPFHVQKLLVEVGMEGVFARQRMKMKAPLPLPGLSQEPFCQLFRFLLLNSPPLHLTFHTVSSYPQSIPTASPKMGTHRVTSQRAGPLVHASLHTKPLLGDAVGIRRHDGCGRARSGV
jgi:hypothetical protein